MHPNRSKPSKISADAVVVGGGLQGCSTALNLAMRGIRTIVIEKDRPGRHASGVNAGGVRRLNRDPAEIPLAMVASDLWHSIEDLVDHDCGFQPVGQVKIAESAGDFELLARRADLTRSLGYDHEELVGEAELRTLVPACAPHCVGALVCRSDGFADPYLTNKAFFAKARALGVEFVTGGRVRSIDRRGAGWCVETDHIAAVCDIVVNCAGAWGDVVAAMIGDHAPVSPEAPMMMVTARTAPFLDPVVGLASRKLSFKQASNGTVVIGGGYRGTLDRDSNKTAIDFDGVAASAATVADVFPNMRDVPIVRTWAGIEGVMPDHLPVIGRSPSADGVFHAFGFSSHGFQLAPAIGLLMAELITAGQTNLPIEPFGIGRFDQGLEKQDDSARSREQ